YSSERLRGGARQEIGLAVQGCDQTVYPVILQDGGELRAARRHLADRAIEIDIGDQPAFAIEAHHVVDPDRLSVGFDDPALHHDTGWGGRFTGTLQFLPGIAVEPIGIDRRHVTADALAHLSTLRLAQTGPGRADRQSGHQGDVKAAADDWRQLRETPALP